MRQAPRQAGQALAHTGDAVAAVRGAEDELLEAAVGRLQRLGALEEANETLPRVLVMERLLGQGDELADALLEERLDEQVLLREAAVDGTHADAGVGRDVVHRDRQATLGERLLRSLEDPAAIALCVAA